MNRVTQGHWYSSWHIFAIADIQLNPRKESTTGESNFTITKECISFPSENYKKATKAKRKRLLYED
jgi:hypothetical protein